MVHWGGRPILEVPAPGEALAVVAAGEDMTGVACGDQDRWREGGISRIAESARIIIGSRLYVGCFKANCR